MLSSLSRKPAPDALRIARHDRFEKFAAHRGRGVLLPQTGPGGDIGFRHFFLRKSHITIICV